MRKKQIKVDDITKRAIMVKNRNITWKCFTKHVPGSMHEEAFIKLVRELFDYSKNTADCDIIRSWERVFRQIKNYRRG